MRHGKTKRMTRVETLAMLDRIEKQGIPGVSRLRGGRGYRRFRRVIDRRHREGAAKERRSRGRHARWSEEARFELWAATPQGKIGCMVMTGAAATLGAFSYLSWLGR